MTLARVDFPEPDSPITPRTSPLESSRFISLRMISLGLDITSPP